MRTKLRNTAADPHGAASAQWTLGWAYPPWLFQGLQGYHPKVDNPTTCVVQVFTGH